MKVNTDGVLLGAWVALQQEHNSHQYPLRVLDIGTGTGVIALVVTQRCEGNALVTAIDIDSDSAQEAAENFAGSLSGALVPSHLFSGFCCSYGESF